MEMIKNHYEYIEARYYAIKQGKELKDLTAEEMEMFRVQAKSVPIREWKEELKKVEQCPQRQDSVLEQLHDLRKIANRFGFYDAADTIGDIIERG
jgi:hypothetical protein